MPHRSAVRSARLLPFAANQATLDAVIASETHLPLIEWRRQAFARYEGMGRPLTLPYRRPMWVAGERSMRTTPLAQAPDPELTNDGRPIDELSTLASANAGGLVHFGGIAIRHGGPSTLPPGVRLLPLADAYEQCPQEVETAFVRRIARAKNRDAQLLGAFINCGVFISIAADVLLEKPLQLLWIYPAGQTHVVFPFVMVSVGKGADVTIMERHHGEGDAFVCGIVDAYVAEHARLAYVALQQVNDGSQIRMARSGIVEKQATLAWHVADLGGAKVRNAHTVRAHGTRSKAEYSGLSLRSGKQRIDNVVHMDLRGAGAQARNVTRIGLTDASVARHHERIAAYAKARGAKASSNAAGLLLSRKTAIEFVPERASKEQRISIHQKVYVGSIDAETMFYLATRGIHHSAAMKMVALGFFEPAILAFPNETIRDEVRTALDERIEEAVS